MITDHHGQASLQPAHPPLPEPGRGRQASIQLIERTSRVDL